MGHGKREGLGKKGAIVGQSVEERVGAGAEKRERRRRESGSTTPTESRPSSPSPASSWTRSESLSSDESEADGRRKGADLRKASSATSSLRSRTFDLREFIGMEEPELSSSSSPSVADTIIARGVEFKGLAGGRYLPDKESQENTCGKSRRHQTINHRPAGPHHAVGRSKSENLLQPEAFLTVDQRALPLVQEKKSAGGGAPPPPPRPAAAKERERGALVVDGLDEGRGRMVAEKCPGARLAPRDEVGARRLSPSMCVRLEPSFSGRNYQEVHESCNSLRSAFHTHNQFISWRENPTNTQQKEEAWENGWHKSEREEAAESRRRKEDKGNSAGVRKGASWTFARVLEKSLLGNAPLVSQFLSKKEKFWYWWPVMFQESFLRSVGAVSFANNPLSGFIIFTAMLIVKPVTTALGSLALVSGILTSLFLLQLPWGTVRAGGATFNAFLLGVVMGEHSDLSCVSLFLVATAGGSLVIFVYGGMAGIVRNTQLPLLNAPFNLVALIYFTCGAHLLFKRDLEGSFQGVDGREWRNLTCPNATSNLHSAAEAGAGDAGDSRLDWTQVLLGILMSPSQIYATQTLWSSAFVFIAWLIFSPTLALQSLIGATIGGLIGAGLDGEPEKHVYTGEWSYNSLFVASALGGLFYLLNVKSWILSVAAAAFTAFIFSAFSRVGFPVLGIPFMLVTWLFLSLGYLDEGKRGGGGESDSMYRWFAFLRIPNEEVETPEAHLHMFCRNQFKSATVAPNHSSRPPNPASDALPAQLHL